MKNLIKIYIDYRMLIKTLVSRELKARYRGSLLGFFWSFLNPLLLLVVYTVVFGFILRPRDPAFAGNPFNYALFLFSGLLPWIWFSACVLEATTIILINGNVLKKVMFPAEVLPIVSVTANFVHFLFGIPILLLFEIALGHPLTYYVFLSIVVMLIQYIFSLSLSFFLSALSANFRDLQHLMANIVTLWFFSTPIIYPMTFGVINQHKWLKTILYLNPMTHIIEGYQRAFYYGQMIPWKRLGVTLFLSIILLWLGYWIFDRLRDTFVEEA